RVRRCRHLTKCKSRREDLDEDGFHRGGHACSKRSPHGTVETTSGCWRSRRDAVGETVVIRPGNKISVDGTVTEGGSQAISLTNLASLYHNQGRYADAEPL